MRTKPEDGTMNDKLSQEWWRDAAQFDSLRHADAARGLSAGLAAQRLAEVGPNRFGQTHALPGWRQYLRHFRNPLVLTLLLASAVSAATGEITNFVIIASIVLLSVTLDFVQEYRANAAAEKLRQSVTLRCSVLRDNQPQELPVADLVPGDVVLLSPGCLVPADGVVLQARDFFGNQALLTGEAFPVEKHPGPLPTPDRELEDAANTVFMGSSVISGSAR